MRKADWELLTNPTGVGSLPPEPPAVPSTPSGPVPTTIVGNKDLVGPKLARPVVKGFNPPEGSDVPR